MVLLILSLTILILLLLIFYLHKKTFDYWKVRNVPHLKPAPIVGNYAKYISLQSYIGQANQEICQKFPKEPYIGTYYGTEPALIIQSPELIKLITTKDFYYFSSREISKYTHKEVFTQNMFFTYGDRWKVMRQNFTSLFTTAKMKNMFHLIKICSQTFERLIAKEVAESKSKDINVNSLNVRFTMDCIGSCVFGVETNAMGSSEKDNPFRKMGNLIFENSNLRGFSLIGRSIWPALFYGVGLKVFPVELDKFFHKLLTDVFKARNYQASARNDFVDLLLEFTKKKHIEGASLSNLKYADGKKSTLEVDDALLVSQCLSFFAAGFETSATALSFTLYELARSESAQNRAAEEARRYLQKHGELKYEYFSELPYLDACVDEAMRLYPLLGILTREVVEDYTLPDGLVLEGGLRIHLPVYHLHHNPEFFPEPEEYRPERFLPANRHNIKPYTYLPFGEGPRICIGMRFAKMQVLAGLVTLLKDWRVSPAGGGREGEGRPTLEPRGLVTQPSRPLTLRMLPRI